jgi:hypothetical protein
MRLPGQLVRWHAFEYAACGGVFSVQLTKNGCDRHRPSFSAGNGILPLAFVTGTSDTEKTVSPRFPYLRSDPDEQEAVYLAYSQGFQRDREISSVGNASAAHGPEE